MNEKVAAELGNLHFKLLQSDEKYDLLLEKYTTLQTEYTNLELQYQDVNNTSALLLKKANATNDALKSEVRELRELLNLQEPTPANIEFVKESEPDNQALTGE